MNEEQVGGNIENILDIVTNDDFTNDNILNSLIDDLITKLVEVYVENEKFPESKNLSIYIELLEIWHFRKIR